MGQIEDPEKILAELDATRSLGSDGKAFVPTIRDLAEADEALRFLENHPRSEEVLIEGQEILNDPKRLRKLILKVDLSIVPILACTYFLQFLDKTTLNYTAVMGLRTDTHLVGQQYSDLGMLFYIGYLVAEFPTQWLAQRLSRLSLYLGVNIMIWGVVLACHAACNTFAALAVVRTLLGIFEACVGPILILIIAMWYKKLEQGTRISWFYVCNSLTQIVGGAIAYGVSFTHSKLHSWRIFYIAIGAATVLIGALVAIFLPDSPVKARRFTDAEKVAVLLRVKSNQSGTQNEKLKKSQIVEAFKDIRVWLIGVMTILTSIPNGGISNYYSILLTTFGYSPQYALLMSCPSGAIGVVFVLLSGYLSDRWGDRSLTILICVIPTILAAALMIGFDPHGHPENKAGLLAGAFLSGTFGASLAVIYAWNASNLAGHTKKVTSNAFTLVCFALGNILGTQTFQAKQAPRYTSGKASILGCLVALIAVVVALRMYNDHLNKKNRKTLESMSESQQHELREHMAFADENDRKNPFFVYTH